jgi:AcrR family transcriptional regulator
VAVGGGRQRLLEQAAAELVSLSAADLLEALRLRTVASRAHVTTSTVNHHFPHKRDLIGALVRAVFAAEDDGDRAVLDRLAKLGAGDGDLGSVWDALCERARPHGRDVPRRSRQALRHILAATAGHDREAASVLSAAATEAIPRQRALIAAFAAATGRREQDGPVAERTAVALHALGSAGGLLPDAAWPPAYADAVLRLLLAATYDPADGSDDALARLADRSVVAPRDVTRADRDRVASAANAVYNAYGWAGLTVEAVAARCDGGRPEVVATFGDRDGLASAVWARSVPFLKTVVRSCAALESVRDIAGIYLQAVVDQARMDHDLTVHFLDGVLRYTARYGAPDPDRIDDPRALVPVPQLLAPLLRARAGQFRPGEVDDERGAADAAALLCNSALHLCVTRPALPAAEVTRRIEDTVLLGMLTPRPEHW